MAAKQTKMGKWTKHPLKSSTQNFNNNKKQQKNPLKLLPSQMEKPNTHLEKSAKNPKKFDDFWKIELIIASYKEKEGVLGIIIYINILKGLRKQETMPRDALR